MNPEGRKGWDLPITAQLTFELRSELRKSGADVVGLLERIGRNRDKALVADGFDPKQRLVRGPKTGRRQLRFREAMKGPVIGGVDR